MIWRDDVVVALRAIGGQGHLNEIYEAVRQVRVKRHATLPKSWKDIVRRELEHNSSDTASFKHRYDFFKSVEGIGRGVWALR